MAAIKTKTKKRERRARGSGGVEQVGDKYRARITVSGQPHCGSLRTSWDEAFADLPAVKADIAAMALLAMSAPTFQAFIEDQLNGARKMEVSYGTWKREEIAWRTRIYGSSLGKRLIDQITDADCQQFIDSQRLLVPKVDEKGRPILLDDKGELIAYDVDGKPTKKQGRKYYIAGTEPLDLDGLKRVGAILTIYFEKARSRRHQLIRVNPMQDVEYPVRRRGDKTRKALTAKQAAGLQGNLTGFTSELRSQGSRFEAMVLTQRDTGFRRGELCALKWEQLHQVGEDAFIVADSGLVRTEAGLVDSCTKTGTTREIPIGEDTYVRLTAQPKRSEYVFTTDSGRPVSPDNYNRSFRAFRVAIGMPSLKPHNLRHTYISLMLRAGVDLKTIQKLVGHASPRMIMEVYGETFDESMVDASKRMQRLLKAECPD